MSEGNSERFLTAFRRIERWLESNTRGGRNYDGFTHALHHFARHNNVIRRNRDDLRQFAELRNAMVHEYAGEKVIAEPNDWSVERIEAIAQELASPPRVLPAFSKQVVTVAPAASLAEALRMMAKHEYSQLPVYDNGRCRGLLTGEAIARWLRGRVEDDVVSLSEPTVAQVLRTGGSQRENYRFVDRQTTLFDVLDLFASHRAAKLEALLITHSGKPTEAPLGIVTTHDLPEVHHRSGG